MSQKIKSRVHLRKAMLTSGLHIYVHASTTAHIHVHILTKSIHTYQVRREREEFYENIL